MNEKIITEGKVVLSRDEFIRVGKYAIGFWGKDFVGGTSHFRPSANEGKVYYTAKLNNGEFVGAWTMTELRDAIAEELKKGIKGEEE